MSIAVLSKKQVEKIHNSSLRILEEIGIKIQHEHACEKLKDMGCKYENNRVYMPFKVVEKALGTIPKGYDWYGRDIKNKVTMAPGNFSCRPSGGLPFMLDYPSRRRREATMEDARNFVRLVDALKDLML